MRTYRNLATAGVNGGSVEVDLAPPPGYNWSVNHIAVSNNATKNSVCQIFVDDKFICGTNIGNADSADGTPVPIYDGNTLKAIWPSVTAKAVCTLTIIVDEGLVGSQNSPI